jgi:hypothetical protein
MSAHHHAPGVRCAICDGEGTMDERMAAYAARAKETIANFGWMVQGVGNDPPYAYSIGMHTIATNQALPRPEIIMVGFDMRLSTSLINIVGQLMQNGDQLEDWTRSSEVIKNYSVVFREVNPTSMREHCAMLYNLYDERSLLANLHGGHAFRMLHMFLPDVNGCFPWEKKCEPKMREQYGLGLIYKTTLDDGKIVDRTHLCNPV